MIKFFKSADGIKMWIEKIGENVWVHIKNQTLSFREKTLETHIASDPTFSSEIKAPHPGRVAVIPFKENDLIQKGQTMIVLEAMKMEHSIKALCSAEIISILVQEGQFVEFGEKMIIIKEKDS